MTFWIKTENGENIKLRDSSWRARIYAAGSACEGPEYLFSKLKDSGFVSHVNLVKKRISIFDSRRSDALEIVLRQADKGKKVADLLETIFQNPSTFRLYNVDVAAEQQYFIEKELFPLARVGVYTNGDGEITKWRLLDRVESTNYEIPPLKVIGLDASLADKVPRLDSRLTSITLSPSIYRSDDPPMEPIQIDGDEAEILLESAREVQKFDPDFIITGNGDAFVFPYLYSKAQKNRVLFNLNRDPAAYRIPQSAQVGGRTYFSYGRIMYRPATQRFFGRIHVDGENTFVYDQCRFEGLFEISRISRMPFHTSSRASIGKSLSGLQFYCAHLRDTLVPYKPGTSEDIKSMDNLMVADRGGLVFVPLPGIHERVCEFDFASLYPSIIRGKNISAETVNCPCCPDSDSRLEELGMHLCKKKLGIVPQSLILPLTKRFEYKRLRDQTSDPKLKRVYNERAGALKWILVTCLHQDSPVLIKQNDSIRYVRIGSFIDSIVGEKEGVIDCPSDLFVAGVGHDLKSKFCSVRKLLKIPNRQKLLSVTMDDGRRIVATPDHPFYLLKNGNLKVEQASRLKEGNFIPVTKDRLFPSEYDQKRSANSFENVKRMFKGDLGFARIRKIEEVDEDCKYVYCFQLAVNELPGFFTGEGGVFTHNCFGYLSFRHAKFMKIDAHIAVCSVARQTLQDAMHVAEIRGYQVIHGIIDSLWVFKERTTSAEDYEELRREIEDATKFRLSIEGIYKWIVFLPSKVDRQNQVPNRYFGAFEKNNELKVRGIEYRRHDSPAFFKECQEKILKELAKCDNQEELRKCARTEGIAIFNEYAKSLEQRDVPLISLLINRRLSKNLSEYFSKRQLSVNAALKLEERGLQLKAGQSVSYVITRYKTTGSNRASPEELAENAEYDSERYVELLADCCATVLSPFGVDKKILLGRGQSLLEWI